MFRLRGWPLLPDESEALTRTKFLEPSYRLPSKDLGIHFNSVAIHLTHYFLILSFRKKKIRIKIKYIYVSYNTGKIELFLSVLEQRRGYSNQFYPSPTLSPTFSRPFLAALIPFDARFTTPRAESGRVSVAVVHLI